MSSEGPTYILYTIKSRRITQLLTKNHGEICLGRISDNGRQGLTPLQKVSRAPCRRQHETKPF
jgi:hypothetical protein